MNRLSLKEKVRPMRLARCSGGSACNCCSSAGVRISPARRSARVAGSLCSTSRPRPRQVSRGAANAAAQPLPWVIEPLASVGHCGARSAPTAGTTAVPVTRRKASRAHRRPARYSVWRLATPLTAAMPLRVKSPASSRAGSKRVLISCTPGSAWGRGQ
ncbi:hypothetical protein D3C84_926740 [compost metagenome]